MFSVGNNKIGFFIAVEGIDGAGKSTFVRRLAMLLDSKGMNVITTCEPTNGRYGRMLRESFSASERLMPEDECRLFTLDRAEHVRNIILPKIKEGYVVICDRYYFSTMAYQGALGLDIEAIKQENSVIAPDPDILFLLELAPESAVKRITSSRGDSLNNFEQLDYLTRVDKIFRGLTNSFIQRINASLTPDEMVAEAFNYLVECDRFKCQM